MTKHIVMFSGGVGSWAAAKRVVAEHGSADVCLLFCDTMMEDEDTYRFLHQASNDVGAPLTTMSDGRDPWQIFFDERFLGNTRIDPCSKILKRKLARRWLERHTDPSGCIIYYGIDWTEQHRLVQLRERLKPWYADAPLCRAPWQTKDDLLRELDAAGIRRPRLYDLGFPHNNCGGFCIKAGQAQFALLLRTMPGRYRYHERREQELREFLGKDVAILRDRTGGTLKPLTLRAFRERIEAKEDDAPMFDQHEWGGCGCFA